MKEAKVRWERGMKFVGEVDSGQSALMTLDLKESSPSIKPMQLFLIGLGGCIGMTIASVLGNMRVKFDRYEMALRGEQLEKPPRVFTRIEIEHKFWGNEITEEKLRQAIELFRKYCPITNMVECAVKIEHEYEINPEP